MLGRGTVSLGTVSLGIETSTRAEMLDWNCVGVRRGPGTQTTVGGK